MMVLVALLVSVAANNLSCEETDSSNKILIRLKSNNDKLMTVTVIIMQNRKLVIEANFIDFYS